VDVAGEPPGNTHEYFVAVEVVLKETEEPAVIIASEAGEEIVPRGGVPAYGES